MNYIHPTAIIHPSVQLGDNNYIGPYCIIGFPAEWKGKEHEGCVSIGNNNRITGLVTIDSGTEGHFTIIGDNCYIMKHAHIGHDAIVMSGVTISCGAKVGGHAKIGEGANLGLNAVVHQKQCIEIGCMIGMGSVVTRKLKTDPYKKYAGNPAKLIGENDGHPNYTIYMKEFL